MSVTVILRQLGWQWSQPVNGHGKMTPLSGREALMRRACFLLVVVLLASCLSIGQSVPKLTSPQIVATFQRLRQTAEIPPTIIYTPQKWGTFRVSIVMVLTVANGMGSYRWDGIVRVKDAAGGMSFGVGLPLGGRNTQVAEFPIRAAAGKPLTFSVSPAGDTSGTMYNVFVVRGAANVTYVPFRATG